MRERVEAPERRRPLAGEEVFVDRANRMFLTLTSSSDCACFWERKIQR